jgi:hypothetical protein
MKFNYLLREDASVRTIVEKQNDADHMETYDVTAFEAPHPEMDKALAALAPVCQRIAELASVATIDPYYLTVSYTKHGTRSATIGFRRKLEATGKVYKFKTPAFKIDDPADDEDTDRQCSTDESDLIIAVINEGIRYAKGERQQILLPLDDPNAEPKAGKDSPGEDDMFGEDGE